MQQRFADDVTGTRVAEVERGENLVNKGVEEAEEDAQVQRQRDDRVDEQQKLDRHAEGSDRVHVSFGARLKDFGGRWLRFFYTHLRIST